MTGGMPGYVVGLAFVGAADFCVRVRTSADDPVGYGTVRCAGGEHALVVRMPRDGRDVFAIRTHVRGNRFERANIGDF